jgi:carboxymethylenebutenolidase
MHDSTITLSTPDGPMNAYLVVPDAGPSAPGVVVIQEAFGVNHHIRDVCQRFAREGYVALAPEIFHRTGAGLNFAYNDFMAARPHMAALTNDGLASDIHIALNELRQHSSRVGVVGFCVGGLSTFIAACRTKPDASVSFYGGGLVHVRPGFKLRPPLDEADSISAPILCFFGEKDAGISQADVDTVRAKLDTLSVAHEVVTYPNAGHGFFCDERAGAYEPASAADAWRRTLEWFERWLKRA